MATLFQPDTQQGLLERLLGARGSRLLLVVAGTVGLVLSIPPELLGRLFQAAHVSHYSHFLQIPIGIGTRMAIALAAASFPAAAVWLFWAPAREPVRQIERKPRADVRPAPPAPEPEPEPARAEATEQPALSAARSRKPRRARKSTSYAGLGVLFRFLRGTRRLESRARDKSLNRRRRDRHPDAPPRPPLSAYRDLPMPADLPAIDEAVAETVAAPFQPVSLSEAVALSQPPRFHAPPRAPEPMSEDEIAELIAAMPSRQEAAQRHAPMADPTPVVALPHFQPAPLPAAAVQSTEPAEFPLIEGADLGALAARFERGLAKREVVVHAQEAQQTLGARSSLALADESVRLALRAHRPVPVAAPVAPAPLPVDADYRQAAQRIDTDVELALSSALATLRTLTEQARR